MTSWQFNAAGPIEADIKLAAGAVKVAARPVGTVTVTLLPADGNSGRAEKLIDDTEVSFEGGRLTVHVPKRIQLRGDTSLDLTVELPEDSSVTVGTASADVSCTGSLGSLDGHTASGDVTAARVGRRRRPQHRIRRHRAAGSRRGRPAADRVGRRRHTAGRRRDHREDGQRRPGDRAGRAAGPGQDGQR